VTKVTKDPTLPYAVITATPTAQLEKAREVLLVWPTSHREDLPEKMIPSDTQAPRIKKP